MAKTYSAEYVTKLKLDYQEAAKNLDEFQKEYSKLEKQVQDQNNATSKSIKNIEKSSSSAAKGIEGIGTALKAVGIGLAIAAFTKLTEVFNQNQKVTDFFSATFETLSIAFNDFFKFLDKNISTASGFIDKIFGNEVIQKIAEFSRLIGVKLVTRIKNLIQGIGGLGSAVAKVFSGDFLGAYETATSAVNNLGDALLGNVQETAQMDKAISDVTGKISNYVKSTIDAAKSTVELNKQAEVAAVINQGLIEKYDRQAEQLRQIRDDETKTFEERIAANEELGRVLDEQSEKMLENVDITIAAAQAEYDKNKNQENYIALLEAQNEREAVLAQIEGFRSEQLINRISLERELDDVKKEAQEKEAERINDALNEELEKRATAADKAKKIAEDQERFKQEVLADGLSGVVALVGQDSKFGKGIAIASAIRDTYVGANKALAQGGIFGAVGAASIIAAGIANVKAITATDDPTPPSYASGSTGGRGAMSAIPAQVPDFNVVGIGGANQLANAIAGQQAKPQRAYVVSNDVTTAQGLERNIVEGASI